MGLVFEAGTHYPEGGLFLSKSEFVVGRKSSMMDNGGMGLCDCDRVERRNGTVWKYLKYFCDIMDVVDN